MTYQDHPTAPQPLKLTIDDYLVLDRSGTFATYPKTELLDGTILVVNAAYSKHARVQRAFYDALTSACGAAGLELEVFFALSLALPPASMPQPDLVVARDVPDNAPLAAANVALVVEVAGTSADLDLGAKVKLYAGAAIPEYWVADLTEGLLHQMWGPSADGYTEVHRQSFGTTLQAVTLPIAIGLPLA